MHVKLHHGIRVLRLRSLDPYMEWVAKCEGEPSKDLSGCDSYKTLDPKVIHAKYLH